MEENGIKFVLKAKQNKAIEQFTKKKVLLAFLPRGYEKSLIYQLLMLLVKRAGNYASYRVVITPLLRIISDQIMEVKAMNLTA